MAERYAGEVIVEHEYGALEGASGVDLLKSQIAEARGAMPDFVLTVEDMVVDVNKVWARSVGRGTHAATGAPVVMTVFDVCRFEGGRIVEHWASRTVSLCCTKPACWARRQLRLPDDCQRPEAPVRDADDYRDRSYGRRTSRRIGQPERRGVAAAHRTNSPDRPHPKVRRRPGRERGRERRREVLRRPSPGGRRGAAGALPRGRTASR